MMFSALRYTLARSDKPYAVRARAIVRWCRNVSVPAPRILVAPLLVVFVNCRYCYFTALRVLICEPLFKAYCTRYGRNLRTGAFLHWVQGAGELVVGDDVWIDGKSTFSFASLFPEPARIEIGDRTILGHRCDLTAARRITIGSDCLIAAETNIFDSPGHPNDPALRLAKAPPDPQSVKPVTIGNNVWIGTRATICPGVTIGDNSIVATGAVVMTNVAANSVVSGNPARKVLDLTAAPRPPVSEPAILKPPVV